MSLWDMGQTVRILATHQMSLRDKGQSLKSLVASNNFQRLNIRSHSDHWWVETESVWVRRPIGTIGANGEDDCILATATHQMSLWDMGRTIRMLATHQMSLRDMGQSLKASPMSKKFYEYVWQVNSHFINHKMGWKNCYR